MRKGTERSRHAVAPPVSVRPIARTSATARPSMAPSRAPSRSALGILLDQGMDIEERGLSGRAPGRVTSCLPLFEAKWLAIKTIRVQKLKSFFTALGVCIGVMFLIAVVSIVEGMGRYMEQEVVGKLLAINSFELRHRPNVNLGDVPREVWMEYNRRPRIVESDVQPVVEALPQGSLWAMYSTDNLQVESPFSHPRQAEVTAIDGDYFQIK